MPRTTAEIAAEARKNWDDANKAFVPQNIQRAAELNVEFMSATAEALEKLTEAVTAPAVKG